MPNIAVCPRCARGYEEHSEEEANSPDRCCPECRLANALMHEPEPETEPVPVQDQLRAG